MNLEKTSLVQKIAWLLFCGTCLELVVLNAYARVITGVKSDTYAGMLCAFTLAVCVLVAHKNSVRGSAQEVYMSLALLAIAIVSGLASSTPWSSSIHVFVLAATSLGGFWSARLVINTPSRLRTFVWLCAVGLGLICVQGLLGFHFHKSVSQFTLDTHLLTDLIFLLTVGPLALLTWGKRGATAIGIALLGLAYTVLYITGISSVDSAVLVPMVVLIIALMIVPVRSATKFALTLVLLLVVAATVHYITNLSPKRHFEQDYNALRLEYYPFSWHVVKESPFLGIGIRTPRENFISDYEIWHPYFSKERFRDEVVRYKVCQNMFLTLMVGLGIPFFILYVTALVVLLFRLLRVAVRPAPGAVIPPIALLIPLAGSLLHLMVMDLLMMSYIAWFFHILLGLIPTRREAAAMVESPSIVSRASVARSVPIAIGVTVLGIFLATHPALDPKKLPSRDAIADYVRKMPLISPFFAKSAPSNTPVAETAGSLLVNIQGYQGIAPKWAVMCILDNSHSMSKAEAPWLPNRLRLASDFINSLADSMQTGSKIGIRSFVEVGPLRRRQSGIQLRVSRMLCNWMDTPAKRLDFIVADNLPEGENNLCAAAENGLKQDFVTKSETMMPRVLLITDGTKPCSARDMSNLIQVARDRERVTLDVVALGMNEKAAESYSETVGKTNGVLLRVERPEDVLKTVSQYVAILAKQVPAAIEISGQDTKHTVLPLAVVSLVPGAYTLALPDVPGLDAAQKQIPNVIVKPGETNVLNVSIVDGKPIVEK